MLDESQWIISLPLFRVKFSSTRALHSLDPPFCFGHCTEVWFRWTEVGEPRRNCILWPGRSQADLWPWFTRWWPANSWMQTGSSIFRQKQRWKAATKAKKEAFTLTFRRFYWTFFGFIQTAVWAINVLHFCFSGWSSFYPSLTVVHHGIPCYEMQLGDVCLPPTHPDAINCDDSVVFDTFRR